MQAAFSGGKWERLVALKDEYDPENVFRSDPNIPPSAGSSWAAPSKTTVGP